MAPTRVPANELLLQGGMRFRAGETGWAPAGAVAGLAAAGGAAGVDDLEGQLLQGRLRGAEAAAALGHAVPDLDAQRRAWDVWLAEGRRQKAVGSELAAFCLLPSAFRGGGKRFVCLCEDVTEKDLEQAVAEGFDGVETLKRYSTVSMGPCQGKVCGLTATEVCARLTGRDLNATGTTTSRPPAVPVELGVLAADRRHQPVRRTPLHHWHQAAGAVWLDAGLWKRPESYGDPAAEVTAVRGGVGLIDVSTLGKLEVTGPDAAELLERVYLNRWADLKEGRARYGAMCTEEGILFDDGVGARLGPETFYVTATTGNADAVYQWLELWRATWGLEVRVLNRTSAVAAVNLAGPRAREVLRGLTALDVSAAAFPYMAFREAEVAGVACRLLRLGFVGELSYEIHCPAAEAWQLWEALCAAGRPLGLRPFGVEAQRILRLENGHVIIGQDTDALSTPEGAGLGWLVRYDKPDFHGRAPLLRLRALTPRTRLVGFTLPERTRLPDEGCQVVESGAPVGRVTSARQSPTLGCGLGLAWVPAERSAPGSGFFIRCAGTDLEAFVASLPFYDPEGRRLRS
jgi:sarcosine oxidase subunit alpha